MPLLDFEYCAHDDSVHMTYKINDDVYGKSIGPIGDNLLDKSLFVERLQKSIRATEIKWGIPTLNNWGHI